MHRLPRRRCGRTLTARPARGSGLLITAAPSLAHLRLRLGAGAPTDCARDRRASDPRRATAIPAWARLGLPRDPGCRGSRSAGRHISRARDAGAYSLAQDGQRPLALWLPETLLAPGAPAAVDQRHRAAPHRSRWAPPPSLPGAVAIGRPPPRFCNVACDWRDPERQDGGG